MVKDNKLNSGAKAFIPGGAPLQANASTWKPTKSNGKNHKNNGSSKGKGGTAGGSGNKSNSNKTTITTEATTTTTTSTDTKSKPKISNTKSPSMAPATDNTNRNATKPSSLVTAAMKNKTAPTSKPTRAAMTAPSAPVPAVVSVWGKKSSSAVRAAPSAIPVAQSSQPKSAGQWRTSGNNNNNNQRSTSSGGRGAGGDSKDGERGGGDRRGGGGKGGGNWRSTSGGATGGKIQRGLSGGTSGGSKGPHGGGNDRGGGERGAGGRRNSANHNHDRSNNDRGNHRNNYKNNSNNSNSNEDGWKRGKTLPLNLLKPGEGDTTDQKSIPRTTFEELLALRLSFLAPPLSWESEGGDLPGPPPACRWTSETRMADINAMAKAERQAGDVSSNRPKSSKGKVVDTAPALEDCKPLAVNDETRWKSKVFKEGGVGEVEEDSNEEVLKKSLLILNKLSLTKFDKLSDDFIASGIGRNEECLSSAMVLIVNKAQDEPHFSAMYAQLCLKLSKTPMGFEGENAKKGKMFKKMLLTACQTEFEQDQDTKIAEAVRGVEDEEEKVYKAGIIKKHYLGHMTFIGELFKGNLITVKIMLLCLPMLFDPTAEGGSGQIDEERVECFAKLMSTIGFNLERESETLKEKGKMDAANQLAKCWKGVEIMAKGKKKGIKVSNRIKFMLEDLIEMKQNGWVKRRKEETAKTIEEIHKEVRREERKNSSNTSHHHGNNMRRQSSAENIHRRVSAPVIIDADGFTSVQSNQSSGNSFGRSQSMSNIQRNNSDRSLNSSSSNKRQTSIGRSSSGSSFAAFNESSRSKLSPTRGKKVTEEQQQKQLQTKEPEAAKDMYSTPDECGTKAQSILKEFFVGGDADDAVLSFKELICAGAEGSKERGTKAVEMAIILVLEMKQAEVDKFLSLYSRTFVEKILEAPSVDAGLSIPLEFLSDIAIDAPLATNHMITIITKFLEIGAVSFDFLLGAPEYFRTDCRSAAFGCKVLKKMGGDALESSEYLEVIEKLMTDDDRSSFPSAKELLAKEAE